MSYATILRDERYTFAEWDEASAPGLEAPGYSVQEGYVHIPSTPG